MTHSTQTGRAMAGRMLAALGMACSIGCDEAPQDGPATAPLDSPMTGMGGAGAASNAPTTAHEGDPTTTGAAGTAVTTGAAQETAVTTSTASASGTFGGTGSCGWWGFACPCAEAWTSVPLDEVVELGFSAEQILAFAAGPHEAPLAYGLNNFSGITLSLPDQPSTVTLTIEPTAKASLGTDIALAGTTGCTTVLGIDVEVTLRTADGALDEQFAARLLVEDGSRAHLVTPVDLQTLRGNLALGLPETATFVEGPELNVILGKDFMVGDITGAIQARTDDNAAGSVTFAAWNDSDCKDRALPIHATDEAAPIIAGMLDHVNSVSPLTIIWGDGETSQLSLEASSPGPTLCVQPSGLLMRTIADEYWLDAQLSLTSEDGRLDTTLPIAIDAIYSAEEAVPVVVSLDNFDAELSVEVGVFEETHGLKDVAFNGALEAYLYFYLRLNYEPALPSSAIGGLDVRDGETVIEAISIGEGD